MTEAGRQRLFCEGQGSEQTRNIREGKGKMATVKIEELHPWRNLMNLPCTIMLLNYR